MKTLYIVWNEAKTEGFVTVDKGLAYEVRKGADSNCYTEKGERSYYGVEFINQWGDGDCTIEEVQVP